MHRSMSTNAKAIGCALLGAYAMIVGLVKSVDVMFALAAHPQHWPLSCIGCIAFWALVFQAGLALTAVGLHILRPIRPERSVAPRPAALE